MPLNPIEDDVPIWDSTPFEAILEGVEETHSLFPEDDERNREYLIRRAALGDNPTQEEMRAVVEYELQQHRTNYPNLYLQALFHHLSPPEKAPSQPTVFLLLSFLSVALIAPGVSFFNFSS